MDVEMKRTYKGYSGKVYLPPDQLNYIAKYYRGLNLNLRMTFIEDDPEKLLMCSTCPCCQELQNNQEQYLKKRPHYPHLIPNIQWGISPNEMMLLENVQQGSSGPAPAAIGKCPPCTPTTSTSSSSKSSKTKQNKKKKKEKKIKKKKM